MKFKAEGDGFNAVYTAHPIMGKGWAFTQQDGTFLTPGIGKPMYYDNVMDLIRAVDARPKVKLVVLCDECCKQA